MMSENDPSRREVLLGMAGMLLLDGTLGAESSASSMCFLSAIEMARLIHAKKLSAREALDAHLKQIERVNTKVNAIVTLLAEIAAEAAATAGVLQALK